MRSPVGTLLEATNKSPVPFVSKALSQVSLFGGSGAGDPKRMMEQYGKVGTLFAIVNRIANSTAAVDWHLYRKSRDARRRYGPVEEERVEVVSHAALDLWNQPNPFYTRQEFVESVQQHVDLTGEGWWVIGRMGRIKLPLDMWCVRPDRMEPVPHREKFLEGYIYKGPDGEKVPLELDEVIQIRMPNPLDQYRGLGPVQAILMELDATVYSAQWNRNFFLNDASPGGIIELDKTLEDTEFNKLRDRWAEQHKGVANAHRVALLEQGKWVERSFNQRDMQFAQLKDVSRDVIREAFGFPKAMLGTSDDVNRAVAEAQEVVFARWLLVPRLERWKCALNYDLLPMYGEGTNDVYEFDYDNPVPEDKVAEVDDLVKRVELVLTMVAAGVDPDEACELVGIPPLSITKPTPPPVAPPPPGQPTEEEGEPQGVPV